LWFLPFSFCIVLYVVLSRLSFFTVLAGLYPSIFWYATGSVCPGISEWIYDLKKKRFSQEEEVKETAVRKKKHDKKGNTEVKCSVVNFKLG
jgi:hypothetical protein